MDNFIRNFAQKYAKIIKKSHPENLLKLLSAIEYTEAIIEITTAKLFGEKFKWLCILLVQLTKCIIRLQLLIFHKIGMQTLPSFFDIKNFLNTNQAAKKSEVNVEFNNSNTDNDGFYRLKHSGRVIRTIKNSPTNPEFRDWSLPTPNSIDKNQNPIDTDSDKNNQDIDVDPTQDKQRFMAEILYIMRPLCHLGAVFIFSAKSWTQFLVPLILDCLSLLLMNGTKFMSKSQKNEMRRRTILFLHYFIRSPIYDLYSSQIINVVLDQFGQKIPGLKFLIKPINDYIPYWRSIYAYCWTS